MISYLLGFYVQLIYICLQNFKTHIVIKATIKHDLHCTCHFTVQLQYVRVYTNARKRKRERERRERERLEREKRKRETRERKKERD